MSETLAALLRRGRLSSGEKMQITTTDAQPGVYTTSSGEPLPRTSSVLSMLGDEDSQRGLMDWAGRLAIERGQAQAHRDELDFLARAGTRAHELIECTLIEKLIELKRADPERAGMPELDLAAPVDTLALTAFDNWSRWLEKRALPGNFDPLASELSISSEKLGFGGTVDCVAWFEGRDRNTPGLWVVDWKTSSRINKLRYRMQVVAYAALVEEECCIVEGSPQRFQEDELQPTGRRIVTKEHAQAIGLEGEPIEIAGAAIVRADRKQKKFEHLEVPLAEFGPLWSLFAQLVEVCKVKAEVDRFMRQR